MGTGVDVGCTRGSRGDVQLPMAECIKAIPEQLPNYRVYQIPVGIIRTLTETAAEDAMYWS